MDKINWYPGHMKKTRELIEQNLKMVDLVIEVIDSRIPVSSRNPVINELIKDKPRLIVLNKKDLSDPDATSLWTRSFQASKSCIGAVALDSNKGDGVKVLMKKLDEFRDEKSGTRKWERPVRIMIAGVPNVGKSSLINRLTGKKSTKTGDRPGVTKGKQWLTLSNGMQLLDTPGILQPNIEDPEHGKHLAYCGSIKDEIYDIADLALEFIRLMMEEHPEALEARYGININVGPGSADGDSDDSEDDIYGADPGYSMMEEGADPALAVMENIAVKRGFILPGKRIDYERCAKVLLDEFREGKLGRITLERPEEV